MLHLLQSAKPMKENFHRIKSTEKFVRRSYRIRNQPEKDETVKVRVIGSGSFGDPASLYVRTSDHSKYFLNKNKKNHSIFTI